MNNPIETGDFESWLWQASAKTSYQIMELFRYILLDVVRIDNLKIPQIQGADDINKPGFDAIIEIKEDYDKGFFPTGKSVWEFSVRKDLKKKANEDYEKRSNEAEIDKSDITYVQATFYKWNKDEKSQWMSERQADGIWKNVLILDQDDFKSLINFSQNAQLLFCEQIKKPIKGLYSVSEYWNMKYSNIAGIKIDPTLHLTSRNKCLEELKNFLANEGRGNFKFVDNDITQNDATAFLLAYFIKNPTNKIIWVANDYSKLEDLGRRNFNGLVVYTGNIDSSNTSLIRNSNFNVIIPRFSTEETPNSIHLNRIHKNDFKEKLYSLGYNEAESQRLLTISNGSISCLSCFLEKDFGTPKINCTIPQEDILPIFLAGRFDGNNENDAQFIENISEKKYKEIERIAIDAEQQEAPFVRGAGRKIISTNKVEALFYLAPYITSNSLELFFDSFPNVYLDWDPKWELNADKRYLAPIYGKTTKFSNDIKRGIAETLVFVTTFHDRLKEGKQVSAIIKHKIHNIFKHLDSWKKWASIDDYLPLLSEAASDEFLDSIEMFTQKTPEIFKQLLADEESTCFSDECKFCGLLWALEALSHHKNYFLRVVEILFKLALLDGRKKRENRPINSLKRMFVFWNPQTPFNPKQRIEILKSMQNRYGEMANFLIKNAIILRISTENKLPYIAEFDSIYRDSNEERALYYNELAKLLFESFIANPNQFIIYYKDLGAHRALQFDLLKIFDSMDKSKLEEKYKHDIWSLLRETLFCFQQFEDSPNWRISKEEEELLEKLYNELTPSDEISSISWMFDFSPHILNAPKQNDFSLRDKYYEENRQTALNKFFVNKNKQKLDLLIKSVPSIQVLANSIVQSQHYSEIESRIIDLLEMEDQTLNDFAKRFVYISYCLNRDFYKEYIWDKNLSDKIKLKILSSIEFNNEAKYILSKSSKWIQDNYWKEIQDFTFSINSEFKEEIVLGLLSVGRISEAIFISYISPETLSLDIYIKVLKAPAQKNYKDITTRNCHQVVSILGKIYKHPQINTVNINDIVNIEISYLPLFKEAYNGIKPIFLYKNIQTNPSTYLDLIKAAYKDDNMNSGDKNEALIDMASNILYDIDFIPGYSYKTRTFDSIEFSKWVKLLLTLAKDQKYLKGTICAVSRILAKTPIDEDGIWPHKALRDIIELEKNPELEEQTAIERMNQRGCTVRGINEGGKKEREIASKIHSNIQTISNIYPRTARMLTIIERDYENYADRLDLDVKEREIE